MSVSGVLYGSAPSCPSCSGSMHKAEASSGNFVGIVLALIVIVVGLAVMILIPILGWVVGPLIMLLALGMGGKRTKVWVITESDRSATTVLLPDKY